MKSKRKKGKPKELEQEIFEAIEPILIKYKKTYLDSYRIVGIVEHAIRILYGKIFWGKDI